ncbi:MAG: hypothetical protein KKF85_04265 [Gammaproteobacteria bacterium]|nr:hypothetical protein [Rhodocyclaceae bacterium]MBU3910327.1 hypothetical protein [Gammaproteobacteria bacterium]MBU3990257.1 hypothetical protein [Gammaproteobacteria bacterium]MBU4004154.1 hypothetical protein [Gammaproteobacteria bacterium]MBU4020401.1 hypothetical protein [Gammaproteobacteria bacterium]
MKPRRLSLLLLALAATAALAAWGDAPTEPARVAGVNFAPAALPGIPPLKPRTDIPGRGDPFAATQPVAPAEPPTAAPSAVPHAGHFIPPAPTFIAPLTWRVIGKQLTDDEGWTVFLARGETTWIVREGDTLEDVYRVTTIKPPTLTLQHLSRKSSRTLDIGEVAE